MKARFLKFCNTNKWHFFVFLAEGYFRSDVLYFIFFMIIHDGYAIAAMSDYILQCLFMIFVIPIGNTNDKMELFLFAIRIGLFYGSYILFHHLFFILLPIVCQMRLNIKYNPCWRKCFGALPVRKEPQEAFVSLIIIVLLKRCSLWLRRFCFAVFYHMLLKCFH